MPKGDVEVGRVSVRVLPNTDDFGNNLKNEVERKVDRINPVVKVTFDQQKLRDEAAKAQKNVEKQLDNLKVNVKVDVSKASTTAAQVSLAALTRTRSVNIAPKIDSAALTKVTATLSTLAGTRGSATVIKNLADQLLRMDEAVPGIVAASSGIIGLTSAVGASVGGIFALGQGLAQIGAIGLVLPGALGGAAIGIGTMVAALADFNAYVPQAQTMLSALQNSLSVNFWTQAATPISELVDGLLPRFAAGVNQAATALGAWTSTFATALQGSLGPALAGMFSNLELSIQAFQPAAVALAGIITSLGTLGASILPVFAAWLADIAVRFDAWLSAAVESGRAMEWVNTAVVNLQALGSSLASIGSILASISRAADAAGYGGLPAMATALRAAADAAASPAFQAGLTTALRGMNEAIQALLSNAGPGLTQLITNLANVLGSPAFTSAAGAIGAAVDGIATALNDMLAAGGAELFLTALGDALMALTPAFASLGPTLTAVVAVLSNFIDSFGPGLAVPLQTLGEALTTLLPALNPIIDALGGAFLAAFIAISPVITQLATMIADVLNIALQALLPIIEMIAPIAQVLGEAFIAILGAVLPLLEPLLQLVTAILTPLLAIIMPIVEALVAALVPALQMLVTAVTPVIEAITQVVSWLMDLLAPAITFIAGILTDSFAGAITGVAQIFDGLTTFLKGWWNVLSGWFQVMWGAILAIFTGNTEVLRAGWEKVWTGIKQMAEGVWTLLQGAWNVFWNVGVLGTAGKFAKALKSLWDEAWNAIKTAGVSIWNAIKSNLSSFLNALKDGPRNALNSIKALFKDSWSAVRSATSDAWSAIVKAIRSNEFVQKVKGVFDAAINTAKSLITRFVSLGEDIIGGVITGLAVSGYLIADKLRELATNALNATKNALGIHSPSREFATVGRQVVAGMLVGLESQYASVYKSLSDFSDDLVSTMSDQTITTGFTATATGSLSNLAGAQAGNTFNYYAAEGSSLGAEEDLFRALSRGRAVGW